MHVLLGREIKEEHMSNIIRQCRDIDKKVYSEEFQGTDGVSEQRYTKCKDDLIVVMANGEVVGCLVYFPISNELKERMLESNVVVDDEIELKDMVAYSNDCTLYLMSIAIIEEFRDGRAIKLLLEKFEENIKWHIKNGNTVKDIVAEAVSRDGAKVLKRIGFEKYKDLNCGSAIYIKKM